MNKRFNKSHRDTLFSFWLAVSLLFQSLVPPGYMFTADLSGGWIGHLCPAGLPAGVLDGPHEHRHHQGSHHGSDNTPEPPASTLAEHCPVGGATGTAALPPSTDIFLSLFDQTSRGVESATITIAHRHYRCRARGPPALSLAS